MRWGVWKTNCLIADLKSLTRFSLQIIIEERYDACLTEIAEVFDCSAIAVALKRHNITLKKTKRYKEQYPEKVKSYLRAIAEILDVRIAHIDETGIDNYLYREYCRAKRGENIYSQISGKKYKHTGIVVAQIGKVILSHLRYDGTMNSILFEIWFSSVLLPDLPKNSVIEMDNSHQKMPERGAPKAKMASHFS